MCLSEVHLGNKGIQKHTENEKVYNVWFGFAYEQMFKIQHYWRTLHLNPLLASAILTHPELIS